MIVRTAAARVFFEALFNAPPTSAYLFTDRRANRMKVGVSLGTWWLNRGRLDWPGRTLDTARKPN